MSQVKCLTCKFAPNWSMPIGAADALRSTGPCQKHVDMPAIPAVYIIQMRHAEVFSDGSGFPTKCEAFEIKC